MSESTTSRILHFSVNAFNSTVKNVWLATCKTTNRLYEKLPTDDDVQQILHVFIRNSEILRKEFRLKLRQQNLKNILEVIHAKSQEHSERYKLINQGNCINCWSRQFIMQNEMQPTQFIFLTEDKPQSTDPNACLLVQLIWQLLTDIQTVSLVEDEDMAKLRNWNTRIDESTIINNIGHHDSWDISISKGAVSDETGLYGGSGDIIDQGRIISNHPGNRNVDILQNSILHNTEFCVCNAEHCDSTASVQDKISDERKDIYENRAPSQLPFTPKPRKKHVLLYPIKRLFRTDKTSERSKSSILNNSYAKDISEIKQRRVPTDRLEAEPRKLAQKAENSPREADSTDHLLIHVPRAVQKIVLVKDGRKISIEI